MIKQEAVIKLQELKEEHHTEISKYMDDICKATHNGNFVKVRIFCEAVYLLSLDIHHRGNGIIDEVED